MSGSLTRREYLLRGVVQGVGFRPHVANVAAGHQLTGLVGNDDRQVFIEAQGQPRVLASFLEELLATLPPLARVIAVTERELPTIEEESFRIVASRHIAGVRTLIPPDVATCADCLAEMADPANRRHGYAFTTCTNCGPRLTIIEDLPYDRPMTTMRVFEMCPACRDEYADPTDRRFHAQPISCYDCGPQLWLVDSASAGLIDPHKLAGPPPKPSALPEPDEPVEAPRRATPAEQRAVITEAKRRLLAGQILAVKGVGGFHLMCNARDQAAVARLRERKRRSGKPFAVMVADASAASALAELTPAQLAVLTSPARPVLIAPMSPAYDLATQVAPGLLDVGVMLPYTPIHTLLLEPGLALVATSGNLSEEPLCFTNRDALTRLAHLADGFLLHDRDIHVPVEDSVMLALATPPISEASARSPEPSPQVPEPAEERPPASATIRPAVVPIRRSRGFAPLPVVLPSHTDGPVVLAVGGELKNTFALAQEDLVFVSAHVGDMGSLAAQTAFEASVAQLVGIHQREPEVVVCDLHPGYATTGWAERYVAAHPGVELLRVQHHYAHALSLLAEHGTQFGPVVVAALDGTGYGTDGTIWGGEILTLGAGGTSLANWTRSWQVPTFSLVGGDRAIRHPWRVAQGLAHAWNLDISATEATAAAPEAELRLVRSQLASGIGVIATSSAGRLFDAAAAMLGLCLEATYEAHAAMALERAATEWVNAPGLDQIRRQPSPTVFAVFAELLAHPERSVSERAWRFHQDLASAIAEHLATAAKAAQTTTVGITGGVMVNRIFASALIADLEVRGFVVLTHRVVPPTDGGLSLGQAWAGRLSQA